MAIPEDAYGDEPVGRPYKDEKALQAMSDVELADYIMSGTFDDDYTAPSVRIALARLLKGDRQ